MLFAGKLVLYPRDFLLLHDFTQKVSLEYFPKCDRHFYISKLTLNKVTNKANTFRVLKLNNLEIQKSTFSCETTASKYKLSSGLV